ncbi:putative Prion-inhibition and propagation HeLo domain-containing protein [Seiridium unicorne]|uniref:Prion-inhibition and propagation HeLo domain-containing protein n=1 Tax=Seiridium unicorne TaxID=138068 RepID=A0ABR2V812_9PEZI
MAAFMLGLVLLQLIFQQRLEDQPFYQDHHVNGEVNDYTYDNAANEWQQMVEARFGPDLADVILRCVRIRFSVIPDLGKVDFIQEMLVAVIEPLGDFARSFQ